MHTITRRIEFCAGHRLLNHEGKCAHLHGHNYVAHFKLTALDLDKLGRVIDFSEVKSILKGWIDTYLDHGFILNAADEDAREAVGRINRGEGKLFVMKGNPTAENLAALLFLVAKERLPDHIAIVSVELEETPNCRATFEG